MKIDYRYNDLLIKADFLSRFNVLLDNSGTGKTFLFDILAGYCQDNDLTYIKYDYNNMSVDVVACSKVDLVILDNADLYMTMELFEKLYNSKCKCVVLSLKTIDIEMRGRVSLYDIVFDSDKLEVLNYGKNAV